MFGKGFQGSKWPLEIIYGPNYDDKKYVKYKVRYKIIISCKVQAYEGIRIVHCTSFKVKGFSVNIYLMYFFCFHGLIDQIHRDDYSIQEVDTAKSEKGRGQWEESGDRKRES